LICIVGTEKPGSHKLPGFCFSGIAAAFSYGAFGMRLEPVVTIAAIAQPGRRHTTKNHQADDGKPAAINVRGFSPRVRVLPERQIENNNERKARTVFMSAFIGDARARCAGHLRQRESIMLQPGRSWSPYAGMNQIITKSYH